VSRHEKEISESLGGYAHIGSGRLDGLKSDGSTDRYQIEAKQTAKQSISIKMEWLQKITDEALPCGRIPIVAIRFLNCDDLLTDRDWILVPASEFKDLTNLT
jgi:Holliday junction resolvase